MKKKGIYYYVTEEHKIKIEKQSYFDNQILYELLSNFTSVIRDEDDFVLVPSHKLQNITHDYKSHLNFLLTNKIIFIDNEYEIDKKCKGYKLREEIKSNVLKIEVENIRFQKEKIAFFNSKKDKFKTKTRTEHFSKMKIDFKNFVKEIQIEEVMNDIQNINNINERVAQFKALDSIKNNELYFHRNKTNNRLDTNLTNLNSNIKFYNNNNYTQIDISNSQPLFLLNIIKEIRNNTILHNVSTNTIGGSDNQKDNSGDFCLKEAFLINEKELSKFEKWVCEGMFYDNFIKNKNILNKDEYLNERNKIKKMMMCVLFSKTSSYQKEKMMFKKEFEGINNYINTFKEKNGYNQFSIMLQKIEAFKVLDVICKDLIENNISVVTIHDSFIVKEEEKEKAFKIICSHFKTIPHFKFENFNEVREEKKKKLKQHIERKTIKKEVMNIEEKQIEYNEQEEILSELEVWNIVKKEQEQKEFEMNEKYNEYLTSLETISAPQSITPINYEDVIEKIDITIVKQQINTIEDTLLTYKNKIREFDFFRLLNRIQNNKLKTIEELNFELEELLEYCN